MTLVQEAARIIENMPRKNQQIVLELLRVMGNRAALGEIERKSEGGGFHCGSNAFLYFNCNVHGTCAWYARQA